MMSLGGVKLEVLWSPVHPDKFVTWGTDISLYEAAPLKEISTKPACIKLSETTGAHLVATNGNYQYVKCVDIYPERDSDLLLALGQANGKVVLTTFGPTAFDAVGINGKEFIPRHARQCNSVAWNGLDSHILAAALDKYRNDHCILLWDIMRCSTVTETKPDSALSRVLGTSLTSSYTSSSGETTRPIAEMGLSEMAHSLAWLARQERTLVVGMNQKQIKIFDLRDFSNKAVTTTTTKAVYGICVDPHNDRQLASRVDNTIVVWDMRAFDKPVLALTQARAVNKILWCPTRPNLLGSLQRDSTVLHLSDLRGLGGDPDAPLLQESGGGVVGGTGGDPPAALERCVAIGNSHTITSFSWHPTNGNRLLSIAINGTLTDYTVSERITLNWGSGAGPIVWSHGNTTLKVLSQDFHTLLDDVSHKIKLRATTEYGLKVELWQNGDLADDEQLKKLWYWLYLSRLLVEEGCIRGLSSKHPGVKSVLRMDAVEGASAVPVTPGSYIVTQRADFGNMQNTIYRSEDRDKALMLCGWGFDKDSASLGSFLERLETEKAYTRAAAIAVFNMKLRAAIDILNRGAEKIPHNSNLSIIAMALSGYSETPGSMWRQLCTSTLSQLTDAYIRALFAFLTAENANFEAVLNETGMSVEDRVAFACTFLSDSKLTEFINQLTAKLIEEGNLAGILLTGTNVEGISLLQQYLDGSGDVQSVSLVAARAFQPELLKETQVMEWISSYRNLLDSWHYWSERALFDITLNASNPSNKPPHQVYVSCNFCGKSISGYMQGLTRQRNLFARIAATSNKLKQMSACPNCRKPLPRCAICLLHMGARGAAAGAPPAPPPRPRDPPKAGQFDTWFTWCQSCRHGGHANHMTQWFKEHAECPVASCTCRCFSIDSVSNHAFLPSGIS